MDTSTATAVRAALAAHDIVDCESCEEVIGCIESEPYLGSALDVLEALSGVELSCDVSEELAAAIFEAIGRHSRPAAARENHWTPASASGLSPLDQCAWKREFKSEAERFERPYEYVLRRPEAGAGGHKLVLRQRPFGPEGFASTVWDSAIVLARYLEREGEGRYRGARCVELGAGCGLPGLVLATLGATVHLTDMDENLPLLRENVVSNAASGRSLVMAGGYLAAIESEALVDVAALRWGEALPPALCGATHTASGTRPVDLVLATDVLYSHEAIGPLVATLEAIAGGTAEARRAHAASVSAAGSGFVASAAAHGSAPGTPAARRSGWSPARVLIAAGRNRHAAEAFFRAAEAAFDVEAIPPSELDGEYQCDDVSVWSLTLREPPPPEKRLRVE